jgi:hypothetical protein
MCVFWLECAFCASGFFNKSAWSALSLWFIHVDDVICNGVYIGSDWTNYPGHWSLVRVQSLPWRPMTLFHSRCFSPSSLPWLLAVNIDMTIESAISCGHVDKNEMHSISKWLYCVWPSILFDQLPLLDNPIYLYIPTELCVLQQLSFESSLLSVGTPCKPIAMQCLVCMCMVSERFTVERSGQCLAGILTEWNNREHRQRTVGYKHRARPIIHPLTSPVP